MIAFFLDINDNYMLKPQYMILQTKRNLREIRW